MAALVIPLLLIGTIEGGLRLAGYGYSPHFFKRIHSRETEFLVNNDDFCLSFFPPKLARWPDPVMLEAKKPANTYRIFVLGESAARGEPQPAYAASRYLEVLLNQHYPNTHFEVINLGITAINSHVVLPIARDCAKANGDLWLIYMGNNEMVGPFGAATIFGRKAPPVSFVRINLALQRTRIGQLLASIGRKLTAKDLNGSWGGMRMFIGNELRADDPRKAVVYQNFEKNLSDIVRIGLDSGARILLNTVAVNLKDCPPFASATNSSLPAAEREQFEKLYTTACADEAGTNPAGASQKFSEAARLAPQFPELHYRWGKCLLAQNRLAEAREHFQMACDMDALPFRADSHINGIIKRVAERLANDRLVCLDTAQALAMNTAGSVCGQELFYEHVHFNFEGNFQAGRAWADQIAKMLPPDISLKAATNAWASRELCERRLGLTDWNRCAATEVMIDRLHRPPFSQQSQNAERIELLAEQAKDLRLRMNPETAAKAAELYQAAVLHWPQDHWLKENFAEFLESAEDLKGALVQRKAASELLPHDSLRIYEAARLLSTLKQWGEAEQTLKAAVALRPRFTEAWVELGNVHFATDKFELALADYQRSAELEPLDATYYCYVGKVFSRLHRHSDAVQRYRQAIQLQPDFWQAHFALADEMAAANKFAEAAVAYADVIKLNPTNALAHLDLGVMNVRLGRLDQALYEFQVTLQFDPGNRQAREYFERIRNRRNRQQSPGIP